MKTTKSMRYRYHFSPIHWPQRLFQCVAWLVIICFVGNGLSPAVAGAKTLAGDQNLNAAPAKSGFDKASDALIALEETLDRINRRLNGQFEFAWQATLAEKTHAQPPAAASRSDLQALQTQLGNNLADFTAQKPTIQAYFANSKAQLSTANAADMIQTRAQAQADKVKRLSAQLDSLLAAINSAKTDADYKAAVAAATAFMHTHSSKPKRAKFDPEHLAFGPSKTRARKALTDPAAIRTALQLPDDKSTSTHGTSASNGLPANLAPTEDVQITPAITAKAQELDNNPLKIYQYVRNNVEYLPTYGSIQGSDYALQTLRGNDMDQASLLIALLRAANIPAHYVYGTIRVPIEQVENWVGDVTDPNAALDLLSSGGVPTLGLTQGGVIKFAQIEHVWVEAQIGYAPSRGAVTTPGKTWVPMDPSFKQYAYTDGMDLQTAVPFDAQGFADHISDNATVNEDEGWVKGVDQGYIETQLTDHRTLVENYVNNHNDDATVGDVIGTKIIKSETLPLLAASLPYAVDTKAATMDALPNNLRWAFHYSLDGQSLLSKSLPSLAGRFMALSFDPVTPQDEATLESYIPKNITDPSQLPKSLQAGVVRLNAEFSIDGQTVATGQTYDLGNDITVTKGVFQPNIGWKDRTKSYIAGDYRGVGLDTVGVSPAQVQLLQAQVEAAKTALQTSNVAGLTKHDVTGALMQTSLVNYFAQIRARAKITAQTSGTVTYRLPSFGSISTTSQVSLFFGVPTKMTPVGVSTDMGRIASIAVSKASDKQAWVAFNQSVGSNNSRSESGVLEEQYNSSSDHHDGMTAVQALTTAASQGQRIYTITQANAATAMSELELPVAVMQDIADSVNAGMSVTTSQSSISYGGHTTSGYIVMNPNTGAAAYKIASGADGGMFIMTFVLIVAAILIALMTFASSIVLGIVLLGLSLFNFFSWVKAINNADNERQFSQASFKASLTAALGLVPYGWLYRTAGAGAAAMKAIVGLFLAAIAYAFHD